MNGIQRNIARAEQQTYDLAIIGGGIYGIMLAYESVKRGLKCILLEKDDFGQHTTFNWLKILHGGLRYLQTLDFKRFRESVAERSWFITTFPEHVLLLPCLMPLYNRGLRRTDVLRLALKANDFLSRHRNRNIQHTNLHLPNGRIVDRRKVCTIFPKVDQHKLAGGAIWFDAMVPDSQRLVIDLLKAVCQKGCLALNHVEAQALKISKNRKVCGLSALDCTNGASIHIETPLVINAAGPWCREVASALDRDIPDLFNFSIAWNLLFDYPAISDHALAVSPPQQKGHTYFLLNWKDKLLVGTGHRPWSHAFRPSPLPTEVQVNEVINDLNNAVPELNICAKDLVKTFCGYLPAATPDSDRLADRPIIINHGEDGGPCGFYSVSGVKFTTSRLVAADLLSGIFGRISGSNGADIKEQIPATPEFNALIRELANPQPSPTAIDGSLKFIANSEAANLPQDLIERRLGLIPQFKREFSIIENQIASWND